MGTKIQKQDMKLYLGDLGLKWQKNASQLMFPSLLERWATVSVVEKSEQINLLFKIFRNPLSDVFPTNIFINQ
jgi:hypothetical protein